MSKICFRFIENNVNHVTIFMYLIKIQGLKPYCQYILKWCLNNWLPMAYIMTSAVYLDQQLLFILDGISEQIGFYIICAVNLLSTIFTVHLRLPLCRFLIILPVLASIFLVDLFLGFDFRLWIFLFDIHAG